MEQIRSYHKGKFELFWPQYLRKLNAEAYRVNLSEAVWELKMDLIKKHQL